MRKFAIKLFLLSFPIITLLGLFLVLDPFRIIHSYKDYSDNLSVIPNRDFVSSEMYLKNKDKYHYNAFILGSSRTIAFKTEAWRHHLPNTASPFVFDASGESIFGIYTKIKFLDKTATDIKNCLVLICTDCTFSRESDHSGHLFIKHPAIAGTSWLNFYSVFLKDYFDYEFLKNYYQFLITRKFIPTMGGYIEFRKIKYHPITNDVWIVDQETEINEDPVKYYEKRPGLFLDRAPIIAFEKPKISKKQISMLNEIKEIFKKHHTNYKIVISPLYDQKKFDPVDLLTLQTIFGKDSVFDFSGKNSFTSKKENYYEPSHYRPLVGDSILKYIYKGNRSPISLRP